MMKINTHTHREREKERGRERERGFGLHKHTKCTDTLTQICVYEMYECYQTHNVILSLSLSLTFKQCLNGDFYSKTSKAKLLR